MPAHNFSYRFDSIPVDFTDQEDIYKHNSPLNNTDDLESQFNKMLFAYKNLLNERADLAVNAFPEVNGVAELSVYHALKRKLFSKAIKKHCFSLCMTRYEGDKLYLYFYETQDIEKVKLFFVDWIREGKLPDLSQWQRTFIA